MGFRVQYFVLTVTILLFLARGATFLRIAAGIGDKWKEKIHWKSRNSFNCHTHTHTHTKLSNRKLCVYFSSRLLYRYKYYFSNSVIYSIHIWITHAKIFIYCLFFKNTSHSHGPKLNRLKTSSLSTLSTKIPLLLFFSNRIQNCYICSSLSSSSLQLLRAISKSPQ